VQLKIYDGLGNEIAVLVNEYKPAGYHSLKYEAKRLTSEIYFYELVKGNYSAVKK